jgi:hypothetical protein
VRLIGGLRQKQQIVQAETAAFLPMVRAVLIGPAIINVTQQRAWFAVPVIDDVAPDRSANGGVANGLKRTIWGPAAVFALLMAGDIFLLHF